MKLDSPNIKYVSCTKWITQVININILFHLDQQKRQYSVVCGEHELNNKRQYEVELKVTNVIVHPKYKTASQGYDIAVYKV